MPPRFAGRCSSRPSGAVHTAPEGHLRKGEAASQIADRASVGVDSPVQKCQARFNEELQLQKALAKPHGAGGFCTSGWRVEPVLVPELQAVCRTNKEQTLRSLGDRLSRHGNLET